jgi:sugar O-acyltransferase (sialic acid O-acetyltransferase NeuD family)
MTTLVLVAASGLAREVLAVPGVRERYGAVCLLDDDVALQGTRVSGCAVLRGGLERAASLDEARFLVCAGSGRARRAIALRLLGLGIRPEDYARVVHPSVSLPDSCEVGAGSILLAHVSLTADVHVGRHVVAMPGVTLTHDDVVGDFATLCAGVSLGGSVRVGEAAYVGMNASVREHTAIGAGATLGMGAALLEDLPAGETWVGAPARVVARRVAS